jgi:hypothetical protein
VIVGTADKHDLLAHTPHVADIRIGRDVCSQVSKVAGTVCIREPARDQQRWGVHDYFF